MLPRTAMAWNWVAFQGNIWLTSLVMPTTSVPPAAGLWAAAGVAPAMSDPAMARVRNDPQAARPGLRRIMVALRDAASSPRMGGPAVHRRAPASSPGAVPDRPTPADDKSRVDMV